MIEADIEKYLVGKVKSLGGEVRKVKWIGRNGAPDRLVMLPWAHAPLQARAEECEGWDHQGTTTIWVELKAPGKKAEPHQLREHERMRRMGQRVVVIDSMEGVDEVLS